MHDGENTVSEMPVVKTAWHECDEGLQNSAVSSIAEARIDNLCQNKALAELPKEAKYNDKSREICHTRKNRKPVNRFTKDESLGPAVVCDKTEMANTDSVANHHIDCLDSGSVSIKDREASLDANRKVNVPSAPNNSMGKKKKKRSRDRPKINKSLKVKQREVQSSSQEIELSGTVSPAQEQIAEVDGNVVMVTEDDLPDSLATAPVEETKSDRCDSYKKELALLEKHGIVPVKKKADNSTHGRLKFRCHLCDCHCENLALSLKHLNGPRHWESVKAREVDVTVKYMPPPNVAQLEVISELVTAISMEKRLSADDRKLRQQIVFGLNKKFQSQLGTCEFLLSGSSLSGFGLKNCDVNVVLKIPPKLNQAQMFISLFDHMKCDEQNFNFYTNVSSHFGLDIPAISFTDKSSGCHCVITLNNLQSFETSALLCHYASIDPRVPILGATFRHWANLCHLDVHEAGLLPRYAFDLMLVYFLQQTCPPVLPVLHELDEHDDESYLIPNPNELGNIWKCQNNQSIGCLWYNLFEFYGKVFPFKEHVVSIKQQAILTCAQKSWRGRKISLEDPFSSRRSITRNINSRQYDYIHLCFKLTFIYFGTPQTSKGPLFTNIQPESIAKPNHVKAKNDDANYLPNSTENLDGERFLEMFKNLNSSREDAAKISEIFNLQKNVNKDVPLSAPPDNKSQNSSAKDNRAGQNFAAPLKILELMAQVHKDDLHYVFDRDNFTRGKEPAIQCNECHKEGHMKDNCPELKLPEIKPLQPPDERYVGHLSGVLQDISNRHRPTQQEFIVRNMILRELERFIKSLFDDAKLELFGSSCNGFGFRNSDLDICLTFNDDKAGADLNFGKIVETIASHLRKHRDFFNVLPIPTAKVPIVKCTHYQTGIDCDISLYNSLALQNTRMLSAYAKLDYRVTVMGYVMKHLAKLCEIGDASRGCLSSYAYTLMVIYFLQQRNPPVIPVLQELYDKRRDMPENIIEDCNVWFFEDLGNLDAVWPHKGKNTEGIGELWLGLLNYYAKEFNFKEYVISIRQLKPLTRFEKLWNSKSFAIEDPFDLNHNLGKVVSRKMNTYIMKVFIRAREVFGFPIPQMTPNLENYIFDRNRLADGPPPNDGRCRGCGRKGHLVRECPYVHGKNDGNARCAGKNAQPPATIMHGGMPFVTNQHRRFVRYPMANRQQRPTVHEQQAIINQNATMMNHLIPHLASGNANMHNCATREAHGGSQSVFVPSNMAHFARLGVPLQARGTYPRQQLPEANGSLAAPSYSMNVPVQRADKQLHVENVLDNLGNDSHQRPGQFVEQGPMHRMQHPFQNNPVAQQYRPIPRFATYSPPRNSPQVMNPIQFPIHCQPNVGSNYVSSGHVSFMNAGLIDTTCNSAEKLRQEAMYPSAYAGFAIRPAEQLDIRQHNQRDRLPLKKPNLPPFRGYCKLSEHQQ